MQALFLRKDFEITPRLFPMAALRRTSAFHGRALRAPTSGLVLSTWITIILIRNVKNMNEILLHYYKGGFVFLLFELQYIDHGVRMKKES